MRPTRLRDLAALGLLAALAGFAVLLAVYCDLPPLPSSAALTLFAVAFVETLLAASVMTRLAGRLITKPILPIVVALTAEMTKPSSSFVSF